MNLKPKRRKLPRWAKLVFLVVLPILCMIVGLITLLIGARYALLAQSSRDWPTTDGIIVSSDVEDHVSRATRTQGKPRKSRTTYSARVEYEYTVEEQKHVATRIGFGQYSSSDASHAREIVKKYSPGSAVTVFYSPQSPNMSVLEPGMQTGLAIPIVLGLVAVVAGLAMLWIFRKQLKNLPLRSVEASRTFSV